VSEELISFIPLSAELPEAYWPEDLLDSIGGSLLDQIAYEGGELVGSSTSWALLAQLRVLDEVAFDIPFMQGTALVLGHGPVQAIAEGQDFEWNVELSAETLKLRLSRSILKPVVEQAGKLIVDPDLSHFVEVALPLSLAATNTGNVEVIWPGEEAVPLSLPRCMIGDSGIIVEAQDLILHLGGGPVPAEYATLGLPDTWRGILVERAAVTLPSDWDVSLPDEIAFERAAIGSGGFSGAVAATWEPPQAGTFFGVRFALRQFGVTFAQNTLVTSDIRGTIVLPFFDEALDVEIGLDSAGQFTARLDNPSGLYSLVKPDLLELTLESIGFVNRGGSLTAMLSGQFRPALPGFEWPSVRIKELEIDAEGNVRLEGGWLDLSSQYSLDFHGFRMEITKLGFGRSEDGGRWIGFSGGLNLVEGLSAGASVEGLRITWYDDGRATRVTLNGAGVEFEVPEVLRFKGAVSYRELPGDVHRFDGSVRLELSTLGLEIDGTLVIGSAPGYTFFAIYLDAELPAGIPLWSTGLALYGMSGLFALSMRPNRRPDEPWYEIGGAADWYHRDVPGVTDLGSKWENAPGALAVGAGMTIGTVSDNGFTFSGKVLLVIAFPGPIVLIQGGASLLRERSGLDEEGIFRALGVLDAGAGTFLMGLDARYRYGAGGELMDIQGGAEAFFSLSDASAWHLYLGLKDPPDRRIRAELFQLFEANSYFALDARQLALGAWIGYDARWRFGPLRVTLEAWMEGNAVVSLKPAHFSGDLWLHGRADLRVFRFGVGLSVDSWLRTDVFDPFHVVGRFEVDIDLPWPLKDVKARIVLEWGPTESPPPLPLPLQEIAVEHLKVTTTWPLPRRGAEPLLLPNFDSNADGFLEPPDRDPAAQEAAPPPAGAPIVPLDARPQVTFGRSIRDLALSGVNPQDPIASWERIGDPAANRGPILVRYSLTEVALHRYRSGVWELVGRKAATSNPGGVPALYGSWAPVPAPPGSSGSDPAHVKLLLWSTTPFDYTRHSGRAWNEWFTGAFPDYPCMPLPRSGSICCSFEWLDPSERFTAPCYCPGGGFVIDWLSPAVQSTSPVSPEVSDEFALGIYFPPDVPEMGGVPNRVTITPPEPTSYVFLLVADGPDPTRRTCVNFRAYPPGEGPHPRTEEGIRFEVLSIDGPPDRTLIGTPGYASEQGLYFEYGLGLDITLPAAAPQVWVTLTSGQAETSIRAFNAAGVQVATQADPLPIGSSVTVVLQGDAIARISLLAGTNLQVVLHEVCFEARSPLDVQATAFDRGGSPLAPFRQQGYEIEFRGMDITSVVLSSTNGFTLVQVCAAVSPTSAEQARRDLLVQHMQDEFARWSQPGDVLEPFTDYRLKIVTTVETAVVADQPTGDFEQTEFAYFRTGGPPGLSRFLAGGAAPGERLSGLDDLTRYVRQTMPATVPAAGEQAPLPRPVYRGYDVGVEFNEDYVDLMYRMGGRDLGLYLYDSNDRPVRDARGRVLVLRNRWSRAESLTLTESERRWIAVVNSSDCGYLDTTRILRSNTLTAAEGQVLDPDTLYEARLVPLPLHETFTGYPAGAAADGPSGRLGPWSVLDEGAAGGPSRWEVREEPASSTRFLLQTSGIRGGSDIGADPVKPGTLLIYDGDSAPAGAGAPRPREWTDYRLSLYARSSGAGALGIVLRYIDANNHYRFSMDRELGYRRLVRVLNGSTRVLQEDPFEYRQNTDYELSVEAVGASLRLYQDGALVFSVTDRELARGTIGLYCRANPGARFSDIRIEDFSAAAPVPYRFKFTTSRFVNFFHHLHSFDDEVWPTTLPPDIDIAEEMGAAVTLSEARLPPSDPEARAYESLAAKVLGQGSPGGRSAVEVTRVDRNGGPVAFLLQSPEPIDWARAALDVLQTGGLVTRPAPPGALKLTDVRFSTTQASEESVTLLVREPVDLTGYRIESRRLPQPLTEPVGGPALITSMSDVEVVDEAGALDGPSQWSIRGGALAQSSGIGAAEESPHFPGTYALAGDPGWRDIALSVRLSSETDQAIGVMVRCADPDNYYRFSMDASRSYRRLIKKAAGAVRVLWEDAVPYEIGREYGVMLVCEGDQLAGYLDDVPLFRIQDGSVATGRIALYCWSNSGARFREVRVATPVWTTHYAFGQEEVLPAGARVRVLSGSPTDPPPSEPGVSYRYVVPEGESGELRLAPTGAELRIVGPYQTTGHARQFLPDSLFIPANEDIRVLRKADGTGLILLAAPPAQLSSGDYRLRLRYLRDNRAADPGSQVFSEAGNSSPEEVTLDLPRPAQDASP
jgi:hypothetical protein